MNPWGEFQFSLRNRLLGRFRLRRGLPRIEISESPEHRFYELILARAFTRAELESVDTVLDVGSRNGSYLPALARSCPRARIIGVELDGGRRYWNGFRRADFGEAYAKVLREEGRDAEYHWADFRELSANTLKLPAQGAVVASLFYPFVSVDPCISWGLPAQYADFNLVLQSLRTLAGAIPEASFQILSIHQGEWERNQARSIYESADLECFEVRVNRPEFASLWPSEHDAFLIRVRI